MKSLCKESTSSNRNKRLIFLSHSVKCFPPKAEPLGLFGSGVFSPPLPLNSDNEYIFTGSTAPVTERKKNSPTCNLGGGAGLKRSHKEEAAANYLPGSKDDERKGDNDLLAPNYRTGNLFSHGLLVPTF